MPSPVDRPVSQSRREPAFLDAALLAASLLPLVLFACLADYGYRNTLTELHA